jgi:hypothetical protein
MPQIVELRDSNSKRDAPLLTCALPCASLLHGWGQTVSIFVASIFAGRLLSNWARRHRIESVRRAVSMRLTELQILEWKKPIGMREWGRMALSSCPYMHQRTWRAAFVNVTTDSLSGRFVRLQTRGPFDIFRYL